MRFWATAEGRLLQLYAYSIIMQIKCRPSIHHAQRVAFNHSHSQLPCGCSISCAGHAMMQSSWIYNLLMLSDDNALARAVKMRKQRCS